MCINDTFSFRHFHHVWEMGSKKCFPFVNQGEDDCYYFKQAIMKVIYVLE